jgi:hypothetical protein
MPKKANKDRQYNVQKKNNVHNILFSDQLDSIKQFRLSKMFCENFDLDEIQSSVFDVVNDR